MCDVARGAGRSIIGGGVHIHIFVLTDCENNLILKSKLRFQKELIRQNTNI